jgi:hypothetical protein
MSTNPLHLKVLKVRFGFAFSFLGLGFASTFCLSKSMAIVLLQTDDVFLIMLHTGSTYMQILFIIAKLEQTKAS